MKTGNCWNARHHTCKGGGVTRSKGEDGKRGDMARYVCDYECHKKKEN